MTQTEKYIWLLNVIHHSHGGISLKDISEKWKDYMGTTKDLDRSTFTRWREAIQLQFHVTIDSEKRPPYRYYIVNPEDIESDKVNKWLLDSVSMGSTLMNHLDLKDRILLEDIPSGHSHLATIVTAMKANKLLQLTYKGFSKSVSSTFSIAPLCVKLHKNRWYVVGECWYKDKWQRFTYGLDRIVEVNELDERFDYPDDFNAEAYFRDYIGVSRSRNPIAEPIRFRVYEPHKYYIMSLPIHHSQRLLIDEGDYAEFEVKVAPSEEFFMEMLQAGSWIEILSPPEVVEAMKGWVEDLYNIYNK